MKKIIKEYHAFLIGLGMCITSFIANAGDAAEIKYSGRLIALPCTVQPGMDNIYIDMGKTDTRELYRNGRGPGMVVTYLLKDCSPDLAKSIVATFTGPLNSEGYLAFTPGSKAKGAAIALEYLNGKPIPIGENYSYPADIIDGDMTLRLNAFLKVEKSALENKGIVAGEYNSVLTYRLTYN